MKLLVLALAAISFQATAAEVLSAKLDASRKNIIVEVQYGGGCKQHNFNLVVDQCFESMPVQCELNLIETIEGGFDGCEAIKRESAVFNLAKMGVKGDYFKGASLTINGSKNYKGQPTSATVILR